MVAADEVCTLVPTQEPAETHRLSPLKIVNVGVGGERTTLSWHQRMLSEHDIPHMVRLNCARYLIPPSPIGSRVHLTYRRQWCVRGISDSRARFPDAKQSRCRKWYLPSRSTSDSSCSSEKSRACLASFDGPRVQRWSSGDSRIESGDSLDLENLCVGDSCFGTHTEFT